MYGEKLALGVIIRSVTDHSPMLDFLENAEKYGHQISKLIICYKYTVSERALKTISEKCDVQLIKLGNSTWLWEKLENLNLSAAEISFLIGPPKLKDDELAPYGICRNHVLLAAILQNMNYLFFFDSDTYPKILVDRSRGKYIFKDIDFIGSHLKYLNSCPDIVATTSDYTGFYIIPRMNFPELRNLLYGLQKEDRYYYITSVDSPVMRNYCFKNILNTMKLLGGNMALNLNKLDLVPPFFSSILTVQDQCYLGRGEDTLFGPIISSSGGRCIDIDLQIFHNCFYDFPKKPEIGNQKNIDRFFYACAGWLIRNPFFNWIRQKYDLYNESINYEDRLKALITGSSSAADYFKDERFLILPEIFESAYQNLEKEIEKFQKLTAVWSKLKANLKMGV